MNSVRYLTPQGIEKFRDSIKEIKNGVIKNIDIDTFKKNTKYSKSITIYKKNIRIEQKSFKSRYQLGKYLHEILDHLAGQEILEVPGLWSWFSLFYFDKMCPIQKDGSRKIHEVSRYIYNPDNFRRYYRHIMFGSWKLFSLHGQYSKMFLYTPITQINDFSEQIISKPKIIANKYLVETIFNLYWDTKKEKLKPNASNRAHPGNIRRLTNFINQIELTYDLNSMSPIEISKILPDEFNRWKNITN